MKNENCQFYSKKDVPLKKKYVRANQAPFINKTLTTEILKWLYLRNKYLIIKSEIDEKKSHNKQRNYCVTLTRKAKQTFFGNINATDVTDNKTFWKIVNLFSQIKF